MGRLAVQEPEPHQRHAEGTRRLQLLTGDRSQTACEDRQGVGERELRGKKRDLERGRVTVDGGEPGGGCLAEIVGAVVDDGARERRERRLRREARFDPCGPELAQES
jgi:hypothetical protein